MSDVFLPPADPHLNITNILTIRRSLPAILTILKIGDNGFMTIMVGLE